MRSLSRCYNMLVLLPNLNPMSYTTSFSRFFASVIAAGLLSSCAIVSLGQSGRRASKPSSPAVVEPEVIEQPLTPAPKPKLRLSLNVGIDQSGGLSNFPLYYYAEAMRTIVDRLRKDSSIGVNAAGAMTRGDAVKAA